MPTATLLAAVACLPMSDDHPHCAVRRVRVVTAPEVLAEQLARYGFDSLDAGQPADALVMFDASLRLMWGAPFHHWGRATALAALGRHDDAADAFARMLAIAPTDPEVWQLVAIGWIERGKLAEAEVCFAHASAMPGSERARFESFMRESGFWAGARPRQQWPKVIRGGTRKASAPHSQLAVTDPSLLVRAEVSASRGLALEVNGEFNSRADAFVIRGAFRYHLGRLRDAVGDVEQALALAPADAQAHYSRAYMARDQRDTPTALAHLELAERYGAPPAHVAQVRCEVLADAGEYAKAEEAAREWCRLSPHHIDAFRQHGVLLRLLGKDDEADRSAERAAEITGLCPLMLIGDQVQGLLNRFGQAAVAERVLSRLKERPGLTRHKYVIAVGNHATLQAFRGDEEGAFEELSLAVRLEPTAPTWREARARLALHTKRYTAAAEDAEALLRYQPSHRTAAGVLRQAREAIALQASVAGREADFRPAGPVMRVPISVSSVPAMLMLFADSRP